METISEGTFRSVQFYAVAQRWKTELDFFSSEAKFLHDLFETYASIYFSHFFRDMIREMDQQLSKLEGRCHKIDKALTLQLKVLELMVGGVVKENTGHLESRQIKLENGVASLHSEAREIKKSLFDFVELAKRCDDPFWMTANQNGQSIDKLIT